MSHEAFVYGVIICPLHRRSDKNRILKIRNEETIRQLPEDEDWPWFDKSVFSLPAPYPKGTFRHQVIHFGFSMKDDPRNYKEDSYYSGKMWNALINKFENILRQLYWSCVRLHFESDFEPTKEYTWIPSEQDRAIMLSANPEPIKEWVRTEKNIGKKYC